jgi:sugar lactone lactonase YvrE
MFNVAAYDAPQTSAAPVAPLGHVLSQAAVTVDVVANQNNVAPPLILNGVAASIQLVPPVGDPHVSGPSTGYSIVGNQPHTFTVSTEDAAGMTIIDPGAPAVTLRSGSNAIIVTPVSGNSSAWLIRATQYSSTPVPVTVSVPSSGVTLTVPFTIVQELWVANPFNSTVTAYAGTPPTQITSDTIAQDVVGASGVTFDATGNLWVSTYNSVVGFVGTTDIPAYTITSGLTNPSALAFDSSGILWVANYAGGSAPGAIEAFSGAAQITADTISNPTENLGGLWGPRSLAFDNTGVLWVSNSGGGAKTVTAYLGPTQLAASTITDVVAPGGLAVDGSGHLWVASEYTNAINPYFGSALISGHTIAVGLSLPQGLAFDGNGNLWAANAGNSTVTAYSGTSQIAADTITVGLSQPNGLTFAPPAILPPAPLANQPTSGLGPVVATPSSLSFANVGSAYSGTVALSESGYSGPFSASVVDTSIASVTQSGSTLTVTPVAPGSTSLYVIGGGGNSVYVPIAVSTSSGSVVASPTSLSFVNIGPAYSATVAVSEAGYSGSFTLSGNDTTIATATISGSTITVTPVQTGSTTLIVTGGSGASVGIPIGVTVSNIGVNSKHRRVQ